MNEFFLNPAMQLEPGGPWWQVFTCHFTHWTYEQLAWDAIAFLALGAACARRHRAAFCATLLASAVLVPLAVLVLAPEVIAYRGLSGLDSALFVLLLGTVERRALARRNGNGGLKPAAPLVIAVCGIAFIAKIAFEMRTGATVFAGSVAPVPVAHIAGAVAAVLVLLVQRFCHREHFLPDRVAALEKS
ncbi:MAG TPA: rhomboid family intramembrane serine protease [Thermoanaerobaculia bacterium]|nr:rhomboid family intramembrane serine protease [Thermoanaerobaculia bacterium]